MPTSAVSLCAKVWGSQGCFLIWITSYVWQLRIFHGGASGPLFTDFSQIKKGGNLGISNSGRLSPQCPLAELAVANSLPLFLEAMSKQPGHKGYIEIQIRTGLTAFKSKNEVGVETIYRRTSSREGEQTEPAVPGQGHKAPTSFTDQQ